MKLAVAFEVGGEQRGVAAGAEGGVDDGLARAGPRGARAPRRRGRGRDQSRLVARRSATSSALPSTSFSSLRQAARSQISRWSLHAGDDDVPAEPRVLDEQRPGSSRGPACRARPRSRPEKKKRCMRRPSWLSGSSAASRDSTRRSQSSRRISVEAAVHPAREHDAVRERRPELGRKREPVLVVDRVLVFAEKHVWGREGDSTFPHFKPLTPTTQLRRTTSERRDSWGKTRAQAAR